MNKKLIKGAVSGAVLAALATGFVPAASAIDWTVSGFVRQEMAYSLTSDKNTWNQGGNPFNGVPITNVVYAASGIQPAEITRPGDFTESNDWNLFNTRLELDVEARITDDLRFFSKLRAVYAWDMYDNPAGVGDPNYFETPLHGDCGTTLEVCGEDYMVDLPSFYFDYNKGGLWIRAGNQQIAWGESIFFRVLDVPNGLDLRRHSVLDLAAEEYSDKRVPSLGVRGSYTFKNNWELELFAQQFQPTIYGNGNTPYNVIASQFTVQQEATFNEVDDSINFGGRIRGQIGDLGLQFTAVNRRNPDGIFRWTTSKVNPFAGSGDPVLEATGALLAGTPFEPFTGTGVYSAAEWFTYAGASRLNGVDGVQATIDDFPASQIVAQPVLDAFGIETIETYEQAALVLDAFFGPAAGGLGDLRGHLERVYERESIFGFGMNYVFFAEPDSFLDQLVVRFEATYTPDKKFTDPSLRQQPIEEDEFVTGLVLEKYQRFSQDFPATFMVLQWMHKTQSDLFGRSLEGYGADRNTAPPRGRSSFNAIAFAMQQPFPSLVWRADMAILWDPEGGWLFQPGVRWKPSEAFTMEAFVNIVEGRNNNMDTLSTIQWTDEVAVRLTYQF